MAKSNIEIVQNYLDGERPYTIVGYTEKEEQRKVGDEWVDGKGNKYIQKNGYRLKVGEQADAIRQIIKDATQLTCIDCKLDITFAGTDKDKKMCGKTNRCLNCQVDFDTKLKIDGKFDNYAKEKMLNNEKAFLIDLKQKLEESSKYLSEKEVITFVHETGMVEEWTNTKRKSMLLDVKKDLKKTNKLLTEIEEELIILKNKGDTNEIERK